MRNVCCLPLFLSPPPQQEKVLLRGQGRDLSRDILHTHPHPPTPRHATSSLIFLSLSLPLPVAYSRNLLTLYPPALKICPAQHLSSPSLSPVLQMEGQTFACPYCPLALSSICLPTCTSALMLIFTHTRHPRKQRFIQPPTLLPASVCATCFPPICGTACPHSPLPAPNLLPSTIPPWSWI